MRQQWARLARISVTACSLVMAGGFIVFQLAGSSGAFAQNTNATIRGQVLDPAGAYLPGAKIVITNKNPGVVLFSGTSDSAGAFVAPQVIPGTYKVTVDATGFR